MNKKALIADDNSISREYVQGILEKMGYTTMLASSGNEALNLFRSCPIDLFITDIIMEDGEGIETIIKIRKLAPDLPIIAMSGVERRSIYLSFAQKLGNCDIITKPFTPFELRLLILK